MVKDLNDCIREYNDFKAFYDHMKRLDAAESNSKLLNSAAPELLEALVTLVSYCDKNWAECGYLSAYPELLDPARAAIAKATGEME